MNPNERALHYPWSAAPVPGHAFTLRPGLHWLRMPLPFALDHINLWLLDDEIDGRQGYTLIDTGASTDATRAAWESLFAGVFNGKPLLRVICTHFHPDHFGLAEWLTGGAGQARWVAPLWMTHGEYVLGRLLSETRRAGAAPGLAGQRVAGHFRRHGILDAEVLEKVKRRGEGHYASLVPAAPASFRRIRHGERIAIGTAQQRRDFDIIVGDGHAPEHAMLSCVQDRLLVSGDLVLPRISTNVAVVDLEPDANPLPAYLASLDRLAPLVADTLVLPSHGLPFTGLHERIAQQHAHHDARLADVLAACATPRSAAEIVPVLFQRQLDLHQLTFALGEALAHLHALWHGGRLRRTLGEDGVLRFAVHQRLGAP